MYTFYLPVFKGKFIPQEIENYKGIIKKDESPEIIWQEIRDYIRQMP